MENGARGVTFSEPLDCRRGESAPDWITVVSRWLTNMGAHGLATGWVLSEIAPYMRLSKYESIFEGIIWITERLISIRDVGHSCDLWNYGRIARKLNSLGDFHIHSRAESAFNRDRLF
jgi:hypothetical protein